MATDNKKSITVEALLMDPTNDKNWNFALEKKLEAAGAKYSDGFPGMLDGHQVRIINADSIDGRVVVEFNTAEECKAFANAHGLTSNRTVNPSSELLQKYHTLYASTYKDNLYLDFDDGFLGGFDPFIKDCTGYTRGKHVTQVFYSEDALDESGMSYQVVGMDIYHKPDDEQGYYLASSYGML